MTTREALRGRIQTVLGPIEPDALGPTLMHEHLLCDLNPPSVRARNEPPTEITLENVYEINYGRAHHPVKYRLDSRDVAIDEVARMRAAGGDALVELTIGGIDPDPLGLADIARATGARIVMGCGYYVDDYLGPEVRDRPAEDFAAEMVAAVLDGAWGTGVRAGILGEIGCSAPWTGLEKTVMRGAVAAQAETGAALNVHPGRHPDQPQEVADFVAAEGGRVDRLIVSHIDRTIFDLDRMLRLADVGAVLEFDLFGLETTYYPLADVDLPNDGQRLRAIRALIDHGHLERVVISHDICQRTRLRRFGGHGYDHIFTNVLPIMRARGFTEAEIDAILVGNPRRLLAIS